MNNVNMNMNIARIRMNKYSLYSYSFIQFGLHRGTKGGMQTACRRRNAATKRTARAIPRPKQDRRPGVPKPQKRARRVYRQYIFNESLVESAS